MISNYCREPPCVSVLWDREFPSTHFFHTFSTILIGEYASMKTVGQRNTFVAHIDEGTNVADGIPCIACEGKRSAIH